MNDEHESAREKSAQIKFMKWAMENPEDFQIVARMVLERYKKVFEELAKV